MGVRKVFLDILPRWDHGTHKDKINWQESIGYKVKFIHDDIKGEIQIKDYQKIGQVVTIIYNNKIKNLHVGSILKCQFKELLKEEIHIDRLIHMKIKDKNKWVDIKNLPLKANGIDWNEVAKNKIKIPFKYNDINGLIEVISYENNYLIVNYNSKNFRIYNNSFIKGNIGAIVGKYIMDYKYNIDDIIDTCTGSIKITSQTKKFNNRGDSRKAYTYKCLGCGNEDIITEDHLKKNGGCNVCCPSPHKVVKGINDIATKSPLIIEWLDDLNDAYKYTSNSNKKINFKCKECGHIKQMGINHFTSNGFACPICGDGVSYPEKFMINLLKQLNLEFTCQYSPDWIKPKRYDFYILKIIIETHGSQHYIESGGSWNKLKDIQDNDFDKEWLARLNNIKNYIILDCRKSEMSWIKNSITNSKLPRLLNFKKEDINWLQCHEYASSNLIKEACSLWNNKTHDTYEIANILNISLTTLLIYLKQGKKLGWCDYDKKITRKDATDKMKGKNNSNAKKIICVTTNEIFDAMIEAYQKYGSHQISSCCNKLRNYAGRHPETNEKMVYMFYEEYINNIK